MANIKKKKSLVLKLRNYFFTGIVILIPIGFTLYLAKVLISLSTKLIPAEINPNTYNHVHCQFLYKIRFKCRHIGKEWLKITCNTVIHN